MKRLILFSCLIMFGIAHADFLGIKQSSETISFFIEEPLDSVSGVPQVPDSVHIFTYADNASAATYTARSTTYPFSDISLDTLKIYGDTTYVFADAISDIDGAGGNFELGIVVRMFTGKWPTDTRMTVQVVTDSLNILATINDSLEAQDGWVAQEATDVTLADGDMALIADTVWQADTTTHNAVSGSFGEFLYKPQTASVADADMAAIADSVWQADTSGHNDVAASFGLYLSLPLATIAEQAESTRTVLGDSTPSLVDQVWDEDTTGHKTDPNMGYWITQGGAATVSDADMAAIADSVWQADSANHDAVAGSMGELQKWGHYAVDSLQAQDGWVAQEASLFDPTTDSTIVDVSAAQAGLIPVTVDSTWDEILTGATHNIASSAGRRLRQLETGQVLLTGTINTANDSTATLGLSGNYPDDFFLHNWLVVTVGTDSVQIRQINGYTGATDSVDMAAAESWVINPVNGDEWEIIASTGVHVVDLHGPVLDQIWEYDTSSVSAGIGEMLKDTSAYQGAASGLTAATIADSIWQADTTTHNSVVGSFGEFLYKPQTASLSDADMGAISDSVWTYDLTLFDGDEDSTAGFLQFVAGDSSGWASAATVADSVWAADTLATGDSSAMGNWQTLGGAAAITDADKGDIAESVWVTRASRTITGDTYTPDVNVISADAGVYDSTHFDDSTFALKLFATNYWTGNIGINWGDVDNQGTSVVLGGTTLDPTGKYAVTALGVNDIANYTQFTVKGVVEDSSGNSTVIFQTDLAASTNDLYNRQQVEFISGNNTGVVTQIVDYVGATGVIRVSPGLVGGGANTGDSIKITGSLIGLLANTDTVLVNVSGNAAVYTDSVLRAQQTIVAEDTVTTGDTLAVKKDSLIYQGAAGALDSTAVYGAVEQLMADSIAEYASIYADTNWLSLLEARDGVAGSFGDSAQGWGATAAGFTLGDVADTVWQHFIRADTTDGAVDDTTAADHLYSASLGGGAGIDDSTIARVDSILASTGDSLEAHVGRDGLSTTTVSLHMKVGSYSGAAGFNVEDDFDSLFADVAAINGGDGEFVCSLLVYDGSAFISPAGVRMVSGVQEFRINVNADGWAIFALDGGTWTALVTALRYIQDTIPQTFTFSADYTDTLTMTTFSPSTPTDTGKVMLYVWTDSTFGATYVGATFRVIPLDKGKNWVSGGGRVLPLGELTKTTDSTGYAEIEVYQSSFTHPYPSGSDSLKYNISITYPGLSSWAQFRFVAPDTGSQYQIGVIE